MGRIDTVLALEAKGDACRLCGVVLPSRFDAMPLYMDDYGGLHADAGALAARHRVHVCDDCYSLVLAGIVRRVAPRWAGR